MAVSSQDTEMLKPLLASWVIDASYSLNLMLPHFSFDRDHYPNVLASLASGKRRGYNLNQR